MTTPPGPLFILSGPSGCGKSTVIKHVLQPRDLPLHLSVSATTRNPRPGESDGVDYFFWPKERFEKELQAGGFVEHAKVHGNYYGTLRQQVEPFRARGIGVILDIDWQGASAVRRVYSDQVSIFLSAPSPADYERRLRARGTESEEAIQRRLANGRNEMTHASEYNYQVINDDLDAAVAAVRQILERAF